MTQKEKQLILKDICARLPYGIKIKRSNCPINLSVTGILGEYVHHIPYYVGGNIEINITKIDKIKPYLRPMSSMTEEEQKEYDVFCCKPYLGIDETTASNFIDWLNAHYFDYRGLIQIGLAIEAPEGMYNENC